MVRSSRARRHFRTKIAPTRQVSWDKNTLKRLLRQGLCPDTACSTARPLHKFVLGTTLQWGGQEEVEQGKGEKKGAETPDQLYPQSLNPCYTTDQKQTRTKIIIFRYKQTLHYITLRSI